MSKRVICQLCGARVDSAAATRTGGLRVCKKCLAKIPVVTIPAQQPATVLSMDGYLALVRGLPLPTAEQRRNFVDYVACAHSWYKHLPGFLPGAPFYFFVDRAAGCDWLVLRDGSRAIAERNKQGFHYADIPTAEYRTRFGFLSYCCAEGTTVFLLAQPLALPRDKVVAIPGEDAQPCYLPEPMLDAGRVELTAVIHPNFTQFPWAARAHLETQRRIPVARRTISWPHSEAQRPIHWPAESGGQGTVKRIFERCDEMRKPEYRREENERAESYLNGGRKAYYKRRQKACRTREDHEELSSELFGDPVLHKLIQPERRRQRTDMLKAVDRVCSLIGKAYPGRLT